MSSSEDMVIELDSMIKECENPPFVDSLDSVNLNSEENEESVQGPADEGTRD